MTVDLERGYNH